jgi:peptidoglycan/xylan/chitin deacetylase (PgdA/CDA1 family)
MNKAIRPWGRFLTFSALAVISLATLFLLLPGGGTATPVVHVETVAQDGTEKFVALTFDDGPRVETTSPLLDGLRARGVHATFFLIGEQIAGNEELIQTMAADGHQIGSHTFTHAKLQGSGADTVAQEIGKTEVLLESVLGEGDYWLRPPYGLIGERERAWVSTPMVYWSLDPEDWKLRDSEKVTEAVCSQVKSGDIILLHDFYPTSVEAALQIVDRLQAEGYEFLTVRELLSRSGITPEAGKLYVGAAGERTW